MPTKAHSTDAKISFFKKFREREVENLLLFYTTQQKGHHSAEKNYLFRQMKRCPSEARRFLLLMLLRPNPCGGSHDLHTRTLRIVGGVAFGRLRRLLEILIQAEEITALQESVSLFEILRQLLDDTVVLALRIRILGVSRTILQSDQKEDSASRPACLAHTTNTATERGGHLQRLLLRQTIQVSESRHHRL